MFKLEQVAAANYHYKRYTLDYFFESIERLGYSSVELWASGPHLNLEDFSYDDLMGVKKKIKSHGLKLVCFTPEQCLYPISVSHPDRIYRNRSVDFFCRHIEASVALDCSLMVVSTGMAYLDIDSEKSWNWCVEAMGKIAKKAEMEGVTLATEPFTKYTTHICNSAAQLKRLIAEVGSPALKGLADTDVIATTGTDTPLSFIEALGNDLVHVHFLDGNPGGHLVPGDGVLDLKKVLCTLEKTGYRKALALEILDRRYVLDPEDAMARAMKWFKENL